MTDIARTMTRQIVIVSGPQAGEAAAVRALDHNGLLEVTRAEGHGLPSYTDPITAHAAGAPNSGHTPGTGHPTHLDFIVGRGDHKASGEHECTKAVCEHVGQTEPRPSPVPARHHGEPYEDDPSIVFLAVTTSEHDLVAHALEQVDGWQLRQITAPTAQEAPPETPAVERELRDRLARLEERLFGPDFRGPDFGLQNVANSPPYVLQAGSHSAQLFRQALSTLLGSTGGIVGSGDYLVTQNGAPNMSVNVAGGAPGSGGGIWVPGTSLAGVQGQYFGYNDAVVNLAIAASNPTNPRIDIAVAQVQDAAYTGAVNSFQLAIVTGTPAGSPVAPATPASSLVLANIAVAALATTIVTGNITDQRSVAALGNFAAAGVYNPYIDMMAGAFGVVCPAAGGVGPYLMGSVGSGPFVVGSGGSLSGTMFAMQPFDPADYAIPGKTTRLRVRAAVQINAVAPAVTITIGLYTATITPNASGQAPSISAAALVSGSNATITTPAANSTQQAAGADFAPPAANQGVFIGIVLSGTGTSGAFITAQAKLQRHYI